VDARGLRPCAAGASELIPLRLGAQRAEIGPLLEIGGEMRTLPDRHAQVTVRGAGALDAAWPDGVRAQLRIRADGRAHRVDCSVSSERGMVLGAIGVRVLGLTATRMLVDGFHSWEWAGVRDAGIGGRGWWGGIWGDPGGAQVSVSLQAPPRLGPLLLRWNAGSSIGAMSVGAPDQLRQATAPPPLLGLRLDAGATVSGDPIRIGLLDRRSPWGAGLPRLRPADHRPAPRTAGWMSWNCLGPFVSAADVVEAARSLVPAGGVALLDDGWMPRWGDWWERDDFDAELAALADILHGMRRRLGVWVAPFLVDPESHTASQRPELLLRDADGRHVMAARAPRPQHVLDASLPTARAHLAALGRRLGRLGADAVKLDFLYAGALPGRRSHGISDIAALRAGVAALVGAYRRAAPRGAGVLGCGAPAAPLVGLLDSCRSGEDAVLNIPNRDVEPPPRPWYLHGDAVLRAQARNLAARAWLWGATVPPDVDAVTLAAVGDTPAPTPSSSRTWLQLAARSGGPLLDGDVPDGRVAAASLRMLRRAQASVMGSAPRPVRGGDALSGSAVTEDDTTFLDWPAQLPEGALD
jgi:alpha-galactosidase